MQNTVASGRSFPPAVDADEAGRAGPGAILSGVFETLERAGIRYCVLHGYEDLPRRVASDVDGVIAPDLTPGELVDLFARNSARIGAEVVRWAGYYLVLAGRSPDGSPCFLTLDLSVDCEVDGVPYYAGPEVLATRRRHGEVWIPAADLAFGSYLVRSIAKQRLDESRTERLDRLYGQDAAGCRRQIARFWGPRGAETIVRAAESGDWATVRQHLPELRGEMRRRAVMRRPWRFAANRCRGLLDRARRLWRPDGVYVALLGPDGAGKSSVIDALGSSLATVFPRSTCHGFTPGVIHRLRHGDYRPNDAPHALPPRSWSVSVARAVLYWFGYYTFGYVVRHLDLARSSLVLCDRHFVDVLVDPKRYRYGGPFWLVRLIWRVIPKPDLIVVLDAPPEVLQARKQEVPFEETARQRDAYLALARSLENGRVVDASQPFGAVSSDVGAIIVKHLAMRVTRRLASFGPPVPRSVTPPPGPSRTRAARGNGTST